MTDSKILSIHGGPIQRDGEVNELSIKVLEGMLEEVRAGVVQEVAVAAVRVDGSFSIGLAEVTPSLLGAASQLQWTINRAFDEDDQ